MPVDAVGPVHVVDAASGTIQENQSISVGGRFIGPIEDADGEATLYAVPALIDSHVHYVMDPAAYGPLFIAHGVAFVRDMAAETEQIIPIRDALNSGEMFGPSMICAGAIVDGSPPVWPFSYECKTPEDARAAVRELKDAGVDFIKVYSRLEPDVYAAACDEAALVGLRAVGHVPESVTMEEAIAAGQYTNEHLMRVEPSFLSAPEGSDDKPSWQVDWWEGYDDADAATRDAFLAELAESGMFQTPTLVVMEGIIGAGDGAGAEDPRMKYINTGVRSFWSSGRYDAWGRMLKKTFHHRVDFVGRMHEAGVPLIVGTDLANPYVFAGSSLHREMELFVEAGIPDADALRYATSAPAEAFGVDDQFGSISVGKEASFFLTPINPLEDLPGALANIESVVFRGQMYNGDDIEALLADAEAAASAASAPQINEEDEAEMGVVGEVLLKGRFVMKFGEFSAGYEDFVISKTDDGYQVECRSRPQGGPQAPTDTVFYLDDDKRLVHAHHVDKGAPGFTADYIIDGDHVVVRAVVDGEAKPEQRVELGGDKTLVGPTWALDFFSNDESGVAAMAVGEKVEFVSAGFGYAGWIVTKTPTTVERLADEDLDTASGPVGCRVYNATMETPMGPISIKSWVDDNDLARHNVMTMAFGSFEATLED